MSKLRKFALAFDIKKVCMRESLFRSDWMVTSSGRVLF